jgi:hypothetical protein
MSFQRELVEQRSLFDLPMSHHQRQSCINRTESPIELRRKRRLFQRNRPGSELTARPLSRCYQTTSGPGVQIA